MKLKAYSLIELLVAISIISILISAAIYILRPQDYLIRSRDSRRQSDLKVIQTALENYYSENYAYPASNAIPFGGVWTVSGKTYLRQVPNDPDSTKSYCDW